MPVYEYVCLDCKTQFDALRPMAQADKPIACESCGGDHSARTLSVFFAVSEGRTVAGAADGCAHCAGGHCAGCAN